MNDCKIYIKQIDSIYKLKEYYNIIVVDNKTLFRDLVLNYEDELIISNSNEILQYNKKVITIHNHFDINLNETKITKELYKRIEKMIKTKYEKEYYELTSLSFNLLDLLVFDFDNEFEYDTNMDMNKLLSSFNIKFNEIESKNYLQLLKKYLNIIVELFGIQAVITYNLSNFLLEEEIKVLNQDLINNGIYIIDIVYNSFVPKECQLLEINEDFCII